MAVRKNSNSHRNQIFEQTRQLIRERGFNNTSIADIAVGCGLSKASIYHYIHEKDDLVDMSVQSVQTFFKENAFNLINSDGLSEDEKVEILFKTLEQYLKDYRGGCLVHNLVHELVDAAPKFLELFQNYFSMWLDAISYILQETHGSEAARSIAENIVAQLAGAIMLDRLYCTDKQVKRVKALTRARVKEKVAAYAEI